jgi:hypothetical protein
MHIMKEKLCFVYFINSAFSDVILNFNQVTVFPVYRPILYHPPLLINVLCVRVLGPLFKYSALWEEKNVLLFLDATDTTFLVTNFPRF